MRRLGWAALLILTLAAPAPAAAAEGPVLRNWFLGVQGVNTRRTEFDVFGRTELPDGDADDRGRGGGFVFGRRFGDRFLLGLQVLGAKHTIADSDQDITDVEALITGTVLFRETSTVQPFLRGGFGGGGEVLELGPDAGHVVAFGTAAIAGGGVQIRLSSRFSLEFETVATFTNFLQVEDDSADDLWPEDDWQVRVSNQGWRTGTSLSIWF